ncbi:MAG: hypothetical protein U5K79_09290 [Cyclobacteriaceae bacterium]|nr:hypothetical protein [Cyclobacteriaceae bacterium]
MPVLYILFQWLLINHSAEIHPYPLSSRFETAVVTGVIADSMLAEASGMVASVANPGYYWVINDSGNSPAVYLIDSLGMVARTFYLKNVANIDWEDIAVVKSDNSSYKLIIADIGDNFGVRQYTQLFVMDEPTLALKNDSFIDNYQTYKYVFEDGARDAETILTDPLNNEIYIVSKRESQVGVYAVPALHRQSATDTLRLLGRLPFNNITAGSISVNGRDIVLKNYNAIFYWSREGNNTLLQTLKMPHETVDYIVEPQGESMTWNREGTGFYTLSELSYSDKQQLYFYKKK